MRFAELQNSCLQTLLAWLQVYRSKSSRQHRVWQMVPQILALTQKLLGPCVCVERGLSTRVGKAWMNDRQTHTQESLCGI